MASVATGPSGRVVSVEADPSRLQVAAQNTRDLTNVEFIPAISDEPLRLAKGNLGAGTSGAPDDDGSTYAVPTTPVAHVAQHLRPDVLVVDCEGCFDLLLHNLQVASQGRFLNRTRTVVLEHDSADDAQTQKKTHRSLLELGFRATACVGYPFANTWSIPNVDNDLGVRCFWSVLQRADKSPARTTVTFPPNVYLGLEVSKFEEAAEAATLHAVV